MLKEFKAFILKGSVVDLAVAVLIAGAFGKIITSFTNDVLMPIIGNFTGGLDFSEMKFVLSEAIMDSAGKVATPEVAINYGLFINTIVNLILVGFALFIVVKAYNKTKKAEEVAAPAPTGPSQEDLLAEIRDLLKK